MSVISSLCERELHTWCRSDDCECTVCHFTCTNCFRRCRTQYDGWCAECTREKALVTPFPGTPCDECGRLGAFRNPNQRKNIYLCTTCHQKSGISLKLPGSVSGIMAECASKPLEDYSHEFLRVRGNRQRCRRCQQDHFGPESRINVVGEVQSWR